MSDVSLYDDEDEKRMAIARLRGFLIDGHEDEEARRQLDIGFEEYDLLKAELYQSEIERLRARSTEQAFVDYVIVQTACIRDLDGILTKIDESKQYNAMVGAVRARSEIHDKILRFGQECGFIEKHIGNNAQVIAGVAIVNMSDRDLRSLVVTQLAQLNDMMARHGTIDITDVPTGEIHHDAPKQKAIATGTKRSRVHKGRKVVRTKAT